MAKRRDQSNDADSQHPLGARDTTLEPFKVGDPLPVRMGIEDMRRAFPINGHVMDRSTFHRLERQGKFRRFELPAQDTAKSRIGAKHWSGTRVARYLTGDSFAIEVKRSA